MGVQTRAVSWQETLPVARGRVVLRSGPALSSRVVPWAAAYNILPNPNNGLRPGQYGKVRAVTSLEQDALMVPQRAVSELQGTYQVAVVGSDNKIEFRPVKVGERTDTMWVIKEGLKAGDVIVAEGTIKVRPGMVVKPKPYVATEYINK